MSTATGDQPMLEIVDAVHHYGSVQALDHVSLTAARGEFLTILGASGSGKTTLLRVISGLEQPTSVKTLRIGGESVVGKPPAKRSCTTVFQNYALFPHMSVAENVGYGLKIRGIAREDVALQARRALEMVQLATKADRRIAQLSGGERQRVALARAVVTKPSVLLLDEPLGALDEKLRIEMQIELVEIQRSLGMTFVYITHSQEEALTMSDRVVLMRQGRIEQAGRPVDLFDRPISRFAAEFMGYENLLEGVVETAMDEHVTVRGAQGIQLTGRPSPGLRAGPGDAVIVAVRAERLALVGPGTDPAPDRNVVPCTPLQRIYRGKYVDQTADTPLGRIRLRSWDRTASTVPGDAVAWLPDDCVVIPA